MGSPFLRCPYTYSYGLTVENDLPFFMGSPLLRCPSTDSYGLPVDNDWSFLWAVPSWDVDSLIATKTMTCRCNDL